MSVHAGTILHVGGNHVIDRVQEAGLGNVNANFDVVREIGNDQIVDKVPQDPDYTFTLRSFDVDCSLEAWLQGRVGGVGSAQPPGYDDADGTEYNFYDQQWVNILSPWKDPTTGSAGVVAAGHIVPAFFPTRIQYTFGVTAAAEQTVELSGGSYYYAGNGDGTNRAPVEENQTGDGATTTFTLGSAAVGYRLGGPQGTSFRRIFGVLVDGQLQVPGIDYVETDVDTSDPTASVASVAFTVAPRTGASIRFAYFAEAARAYPQSVHASALVKPGEIRGRNICVYIGSGGQRVRLGSVQAATLEARVDSAMDREFCNIEIVGITINSRDVTGSLTVRSKDTRTFIATIARFAGVAASEVVGFLNQNPLPLEIAIQNPKNPAQILKTLYVKDAIFEVPGTPARVNTPTDFVVNYQSQTGTYSAFKGAKP